MFNLIPTENWDYHTPDVLRGVLNALRHDPATNSGIRIPGLGTCQPIRSGRVGIFLAIKALRLRPNASVGVPLYCCPVVFKAIQAAGCTPRFIDVDCATYCMSAKDLAAKSSQVDAVIAVHMFGNVCDMLALRQAAPNKPFIEDCAQALGSRLDDQLVGSFGEIGVFSFRSGKYVSVGEGGALFCHDLNLEARVEELLSALPAPSTLQEFVHVTKTWIRSSLRRRPLWGLAGSRLWEIYNATARYTFKSPLVLTRIYGTDYEMTLLRLRTVPKQIEKQRINARYYEDNLKVPQEMLSWEAPGAQVNRLQYPLLPQTALQCDRMVQHLRFHQITTARPYRDIHAIAAAHYQYRGDCPQSEYIAQRVLVVPCHYDLKLAEVERITEQVNLAWERSGGRARAVAGEIVSRAHVNPDPLAETIVAAKCGPIQHDR